MRKAVREKALQQKDAHSEPLLQTIYYPKFDNLNKLELNDICHDKRQQSFQCILSLVKEKR